MKCLVIGYGSIGKRHARLLTKLGNEVRIVSNHLDKQNSNEDVCLYPHYSSISTALKKDTPEYIIVSDPTANHFQTLQQLIDLRFNGSVLVEKPLFHQKEIIPPYAFRNLYVGYNLRFHPILQKIKQYLEEENIISFHVYVGQYLPGWRTGQNYSLNYSAFKKQGGGVLRDLSHELDYIQWLCGKWKRLVSLGGHFSNLKIDSDDLFTVILQTEHCPMVTVHMNYLDRVSKREITINTKYLTIRADLIEGRLQVNNSIFHYSLEKDQTYLKQHEAILSNDQRFLCTGKEGLEVVEMIESIEESCLKRKWLER